MFEDEYECVRTCIFSTRVLPEVYHNLLGEDYNEGNDTIIQDTTTIQSETKETDIQTTNTDQETNTTEVTKAAEEEKGEKDAAE